MTVKNNAPGGTSRAATVPPLAVHPSDPRVPAREVCVVRYLLDRWAVERGGNIYVIFDSKHSYTYREMRERTIGIAAGLARLGVKQGDHVLA